MEIKIQLKNYVLAICIGRVTVWYQQTAFITVVKEEYEECSHSCHWAEMLWHSPF